MSSMSSYGKLCRIFGAERVNKDSELMEQIIELQTVFEDKETLLHQLRMLDGLSDSDCELLARTHYTMGQAFKEVAYDQGRRMQDW